MAVETQDSAIERGEHVVQFYEDDAELLEAVGPYLTAAAVAGDVAIVIATEAHRHAFEAALEGDGIDVARIIASGMFLWLDAASTMAEFITDGEIDHDAFDEVVGGLMRTAAESGRPVRAYGEMVALLWDEGNVLGAIELERLWNELARELPFSLFCSYPAGSVAGSEHAEALHQVCHLHSSVLQPPASEEPDVAGDGAWEKEAAALEEEAAVEEMAVEVVAEFAAEREAPGRARRLAVTALRQRGHDESLVQDAALVLSELATNAVVHAGSAFSVAVQAQESVLRVAVQDASPLDAASPEQGLIARTGHGLGLIDVLATRWGVEAAASGKVVWAELPYA